MHHTLRLYAGNRGFVLRLYMFFAAWTKIPLLGRLVRRVANAYGRTAHRAYLLTPDEADELIELSEGVAAGPCDCRTLARNCDNPRDNEILLGPTRHVMLETMPHGAREIDKDQARAILRDSHRHGLIFTIVRCREDYYAICSCCTCCCVPLRLKNQYGIGDVVVRHKGIVEEFREYQARQLATMHD
jgi:hypothetical protein